jgi:hypothetical protein
MSDYGNMTVSMQVQFRKPGQDNCTWHKLVMLHREQHVTVDQAKEILAKWKAVNPEVIGSFQMGLY